MQGFQDDPCDDWSDRPLSRLGSDSRVAAGTPEGWTLCGYLAMVAYVEGKCSMWALVYARVNGLLERLTGEDDHCFHALQRSIERAVQ